MVLVAVTVAGAAAAAWASAVSAGSAQTAQTRERLTGSVVATVESVAPQLTFPADESTLGTLRSAIGPDTAARAGALVARDGRIEALVSDELQAAVGGGDGVFTQQVVAEGMPWLVIGTPVMVIEPDGTRRRSGIEVYTAADLTGIDRELGALSLAAAGAAALTLPMSLLLAVLSANTVLRPVRELRATARRLAAGDLTARGRAQGRDELADLTATVDEMAESLQASMAEIRRMQADARRFVADVSHELRTPLSTLSAVLEVLDSTTAALGENVPDDARESAALAIAETHRLIRLVEDLMEVSRLDAGTAELRLEEIDLAAAVADCVRVRGWADLVTLSATGPVPARLDPRRVDVIVANLVGNALRHGRPPVRIEVTADGDRVEIEVTDAGPGLPEDVLPHVFARFYKADAARTRSPGSGLGLAIALQNARLHGGDVGAENRVEGGARFVVRMPREGGTR
ncbi:HAMP domain-containing sensor histidine kinase [Pseudonocardia sp. NPDC049635]|uniref:sensor histidine kinase n=1 Tax=Pseudonocardia sp. NPDC049635 TaxID=3155506 RepID=UPI0033D86C98